MVRTDRWTRGVWLPLVAGLAWLWTGGQEGILGFVYSLPVGVLLVAAGMSSLKLSGDRRARELACSGAGLGILLAVPGLFVYGPLAGGLLLGLSLGCFIDAGASAVQSVPAIPGIPAPEPDLKLSAKVAIDEALLGTMGLSIPMPGSSEIMRIAHEVAEAREIFDDRGWLEKPEEYHRTPLPLEVPRLESARVRVRGGAVDYEHLSFESEYEPLPEEPGRERWLSYGANRMAHAWVLRHSDGPRPWLVCIHGYMMGSPMADFGLFDPRYLHEKKGFNLLLPTLPLHGRRKSQRLSGDGFLSGDVLDTIHAETQAMWDIRRLLTWVESQDPEAIGVYGVSLGGCAASLLSSIAPRLSGVIAGVPLSDFARIFWTHGPPQLVRDYLEMGIKLEDLSEIFRVVSPLAIESKVEHERRAIYAGLADRLVPIDQVADLWQHWDQPKVAWYNGSHISFMRDPQVRSLIDSSLDAMQA